MNFLTKSFAPKKDPDRSARDAARAASRPWTFQEFFENRYHNGQHAGIDFARIIASSDGSRASDDHIKTYDYADLAKVFKFCANKGCNIEHQSRAKMSGWTPGDLTAAVEWDFLETMAQF